MTDASKLPEPTKARVVSVERIGVGSGPFAIVVSAFGRDDAKAVLAALETIGVRPVCAVRWEEP